MIVFRLNFRPISQEHFSRQTLIFAFLAETTLATRFKVVDYKAFKNHRNAWGGGQTVYVGSNLPVRRTPDLELQWPIETIFLDVIINDRKASTDQHLWTKHCLQTFYQGY